MFHLSQSADASFLKEIKYKSGSMPVMENNSIPAGYSVISPKAKGAQKC